MVKDKTKYQDIEPPFALRPTQTIPVKTASDRLLSAFRRKSPTASWATAPAFKPVALGTAAAIAFSFVFDIGPWDALTGRINGSADAQEAPQTSANAFAEPSEADRAALRYFAREGATERLEAELRRLRVLYPGWTPPRDLLDPDGEDVELQRIYDLVGDQNFEEARRLIADRQRRDPTFQTPPRLQALLELAEARATLRTASDARNFAQVLQIAEANEQILTCEDPDSIWRVAEAFAETGRPQRAFDAYVYVIETCDEQGIRAASLQKASEELDPSYVTQLFSYVTQSEDGQLTAMGEAQLDIIRGLIAQAGQENAQGMLVPQDWITILANFARTGENLDDAMLIGYYLYRQGAPADAAQWFRFALDNGLGSDAAEGYIIALRATGDREDSFLAREVAYQWREQTPELMEAYLDAVATILTADEYGETSIEDVEQTAVDRFAPIVIEQRDANGAQALGWYAFNTCQFIIAEEWFISSANWVPTEAAMFGLALSRLRLGDMAGFQEVVDEWGPLYPAVQNLATGLGPDQPEDPVSGALDDPSDEVGVDSLICDPEERRRLRALIVEQQERTQGGDRLSFTQAGSLTAAQVRPMTSRPEGAVRPAIPRRSVVIDPTRRSPESILRRVQLELPLPTPGQQQIEPVPVQPSPSTVAPPLTAAPPAGVRPQPITPAPVTQAPGLGAPVTATPGAGQPVRITRSPTAPAQAVSPRTATPARIRTASPSTATLYGDTVERRVRAGLPTATDDQVMQIINAPVRTRTVGGGGGGGGGTAAQRALTARNYSRCIAITDAGIRDGRLSAEDASARGFCLLQLNRPVEAAQAFQLAKLRTRVGTSEKADAVYGSTLAYIAANLTKEAAIAATQSPLSRPRRTELQTQILTQRALAANRDGRYIEALYFLDQRNKIAPLQKDLMLLQGFAYRDAGNYRAAQQIFEALDKAGSTKDTRAGLYANAVSNRRPIGGAIIRVQAE
ncbi:hypothetical protein [Acuticoccus yangtzensis]|uniref:hypothetical protein n=1 Tax=Acuticoccus yangtzensis TaxID=1443441 RepID=UPI000949AD7E|nr:hypothetical protein [Acuticoccus yangtzensis]ORE93148.1 hypothetical protein ATO13_15240 [Stappia sp. 22II-S9-Z10]